MDCRSFIALRHERWLALRLFDKSAEKLLKPSFSQQLLHCSDTHDTGFVRVISSVYDSLGNRVLIDVATVASTLDYCFSAAAYTR